MSGLYVDTSALARVLLNTAEKQEIVARIAGRDLVISSRLLRIELRRVALREGELDGVDQLLAGISLVPVDEGILVAAESVKPANVATLDALHLATIVRLAGADVVDAVLTYDRRLAAGARQHGLEVVAPV